MDQSPTVPLTTWDVPPPVLFNPWKHHAAALRRLIADTAAAGPSALAELPGRLRVIGTELMDLYTGSLTPAAIAAGVIGLLRAEGHLAADRYRVWLEENGGYRVVTLPEDGSVWVLRFAEEKERYVHVHPGRWAPQTRRVRANVLKTAVLVLAHAAAHGADPFDLALINRLRENYLGLSPIGALAKGKGLAEVMALLAAPA